MKVRHLAAVFTTLAVVAAAQDAQAQGASGRITAQVDGTAMTWNIVPGADAKVADLVEAGNADAPDPARSMRITGQFNAELPRKD